MITPQNEPGMLTPAVRLMLSVHEATPGVTESILAAARTADGRTSYEILRDAAGPLSGRTVLDLACGSGGLAELLAAQVGAAGQVIGVDLSSSELDLARQRLSKTANVQLFCAAAERLPLPVSSVDAVFCHMALMLFAPLDAVVAQIARVLRPGGTFAAVIPSVTVKNDLFLQIRGSLAAGLDREVAKPDRVPLGDVATTSVEGIRQVFAAAGNFTDDIKIGDFEVSLSNQPAVLAAQLLPFFYHSHLLSADGKNAVISEWRAILQKRLDAGGMAAFQLPLTVLTVSKNKSLTQLWGDQGK